MIRINLCKKIVYAIEQAAAARYNLDSGCPDSVGEVLEEAIAKLESALRMAAANAE